MPDEGEVQDNPLYWSLADLLAAYRRRDVSPVEVLELALSRIDAINPAIHAFLGRTDELAREQAKVAERAYRAGTAGPLAGIPVSIKDTFQIEGHVATFGSKAHPATVSSFDSGVVSRLRAAGAVFTGRTNTAEFGQSATTENLFFADVCNPWDTARTTGGSSGGAAASVLTGMSSIALGADGGGSVRIPAAFAGLVGLKPSYGLCPNERGLAAMSDFICPGPLAWRGERRTPDAARACRERLLARGYTNQAADRMVFTSRGTAGGSSCRIANPGRGRSTVGPGPSNRALRNRNARLG